jgi:hypothetical protein
MGPVGPEVDAPGAGSAEQKADQVDRHGPRNAATKVAVAGCGPRAIVLWRESMEIHDMQYLSPDKRLRPGDIILAHFRGPAQLKGETMTAMFVALLKHIERQGFAVARLEDYIQPPRHGAAAR